MKMKNAPANKDVASQMRAMARIAAPVVKTGVKMLPVAFFLWQCKAPEQAQTIKRPVIAVVNDIDNYEIKDSKPGSSKVKDASPLGISINNTGKPNNPKTYYYVPASEEARTLYGGSYEKMAAPYEFRVNTGMGLFGKSDTTNVGIVACSQLLEFLTKTSMVNVSGGYVRLVNYPDKRLFTKDHSGGYASKNSYIISRNENGLAAIYMGAKAADSNSFALWVLPEKMSNYSIKVPFSIVPEGDAALRLDSNFFAYTSGGRRQIQVAIDQETPVTPSAAVEDFKYVPKNATNFGFSDGQNVVYTPTNAVYVGDSVMKYATGDSVFSTARGDTAMALDVVSITESKLSKMLGNVKRAGMGIVVTRTGAVATYWRLIQGDADSTAAPSAVTLPLTKHDSGLRVIENCNTDNTKPEVFNPVTCEKLNLFSFITNVPGEKDTMQLRILRENDGDVISLKLGMADVSKITHTQKGKDVWVTLFGKNGTDVVATVIISEGVPYKLIRTKNNILQDKAQGPEPVMKNRYNEMLYTDTKQQNRYRSRFANRSI